MNDVMEALKDDRFHMITICGMGGVGKTTMVKEVAKRAKEEKLFDEVVMAVVSQSPNERKIQGEIGDNLGLKFEEETERGRANRPCERLKAPIESLSYWTMFGSVSANDIGIPFGDGHRGCKIVLTSRFDNVCNDMNAQKKFTIEVLVKKKHGISSEMVEFPTTRVTQASIYLVRYGVGIEMFEAIDSVNEARDRVHAFVDDLKKGYLLMDGEQGCVKIHDVVRDVAISIASREEHSFMVRCDEALKEWPEKERHKNYAVISLRCTGMSKLPDNLEFPKLHLLRLEDNYASKLPNLPDSFYGGMKELKALSMLNVYIKGSLPTSLRWLTNLRSLSLYECGLINDVSAIGALENLEILSFEGTEIEELPKEIGRLSHLKLFGFVAMWCEEDLPVFCQAYQS
ncbi:putative disease resistance protein [Camellia lanceoleosa]|uniref:Disease resistance protein n=1 Tax=Camellia lanceoleosa TaxID=1840588 RepID=A0ACC0GS95_9ERIC|nr:putative disease resistance protein [Camellia lanceoleosa]